MHSLVMISLFFQRKIHVVALTVDMTLYLQFFVPVLEQHFTSLAKNGPICCQLVFLLVSHNQLSFLATFVLFREFLNFVWDEISDLCKFGYQSTCKKVLYIIFPQILI